MKTISHKRINTSKRLSKIELPVRVPAIGVDILEAIGGRSALNPGSRYRVRHHCCERESVLMADTLRNRARRTRLSMCRSCAGMAKAKAAREQPRRHRKEKPAFVVGETEMDFFNRHWRPTGAAAKSNAV